MVYAQIVLKSTLLLALAWLAVLCLRRKSAAVRHQVWTLALAAVLVLPLFSMLLPAWRVPVGDLFLLNRFFFRTEARASTGKKALPSSRQVDFGTLFITLWGFGMAASLSQMMVGWAMAERIRRSAKPIYMPEIEEEIELRQTAAASMPITFGLFRPVILLPADATQWSTERRRIVLLHELAHIQRRDGATHLVARLTLALYWWHPLVWAAWRESVKERECAADDLVLAAGAGACEYAGHLLDLARSMQPPQAAIAMLRASQLQNRLAAILDSKRDRRALQPTAIIAALLAVLAILIPVAAMRAKEGTGATTSGGAKATSVNPAPSARLYRIGGDVKAPVLLSKIEPQYSEEARLAKYSGSVLLDIEVGEDGLTRNIRVTRPLGFGLDQKAVEAVSHWKFIPATLNGQPVAVSAEVEVDFRLQ